MTTNSFEDAIEKFLAVAPEVDDLGVKILDAALADVIAYRDSRCIAPLLMSLDDSIRDEVAAFSIIHTVEYFDDPIYVTELLPILPGLCRKAPKWTSIVLMRCLNSPGTIAVLVRQLRDADDEVKQTVRWLCEKINEQSPTFLAKTLPVLLAVK